MQTERILLPTRDLLIMEPGHIKAEYLL